MPSTILITGAGQGLGLSLAELYVGSGWNVIATTFAHSERILALVDDDPERVLAVEMDVSNADAIAAAKREIGKRFACIDVLVNNAGILPAEGRGPLGQLNYEAGMRIYDINALGPLRVTEAFLPLIVAGSRRLVVNISSEAGSIGSCWRKDEYFYCMSKAALNMQSAILRNALKEQNIDLLALHPGWMRTQMGGAEADIEPAEAAQGIAALVLGRRDGESGIYFDYRGEALVW